MKDSLRSEVREQRSENRKFLFCLLFSVLCSLILTGCGYSTTRLLPANYQKVAIEPLENRIPFTEEVSERAGYQANLPRLEERATRGLIDRFLFDGSLRVATKREEADLILEGALIDFSRQPVRRTDDNTVEEYRLNLVASLTLRDKKGALVWEEPSFIGDTTYFLSGSLAKSETAAVEDLITDFSRRVVERVVEDW